MVLERLGAVGEGDEPDEDRIEEGLVADFEEHVDGDVVLHGPLSGVVGVHGWLVCGGEVKELMEKREKDERGRLALRVVRENAQETLMVIGLGGRWWFLVGCLGVESGGYRAKRALRAHL